MSRFDELVALMARLRAPDGCPWDRAQTHASLKGMLLEEACEVMAEIERGDPAGLRDELGDLLLHVVFHAQIAAENDDFTIEDVAGGIRDKLVRRHPHVFGAARADNPDAVKQTWEKVKEGEGKGTLTVSDLLPALVAARKLQERAQNADRSLPVRVDPARLEALLPEGDEPEEAVGALLFAAVSLARARGVEPEWALAKTLKRLQQDHGAHPARGG